MEIKLGALKDFVLIFGLFLVTSAKRMAYLLLVRVSLKSNVLFSLLRPMLKRDLY